MIYDLRFTIELTIFAPDGGKSSIINHQPSML